MSTTYRSVLDPPFTQPIQDQINTVILDIGIHTVTNTLASE